MLRNMVNKWNTRLSQALRSEPQLRIARLTLLRDDIEALADSLVRASYIVHDDIMMWIRIVNKSLSMHKAS